MNTEIHSFLRLLVLYCLLLTVNGSTLIAQSHCYQDKQYPNQTSREVLDSLLLLSRHQRITIEQSGKLEEVSRHIICIAEELVDLEAKCYGQTYLALHNYIEINIDTAFHYINQANARILELDNQHLKGYIHTIMGLIYLEIDHLEVAASFFLESKKIYERAHDTIHIIGALTNLGSTYSDVGLMDKNHELLLEAEQLLKEHSDVSANETILWLYNALGWSYCARNDIEASIKYFDLAIDQGRRIQYDKGLLWAHHAKASIYLESDIEKVEDLLEEIKPIIDRNDNIRIYCGYNSTKAYLLEKQGKTPQALALLENTWNKAQEYQIFSFKKSILNQIIDLCDRSGQIAKQNRYQNKLVNVVDEQMNDMRLLLFDNWTTNIDAIHSKENALMELEQEKAKLAKEVQWQRVAMLVGCTILLGMIIFAVFNRKIIANKQKYLDALLLKNKDIERQLSIIQSQKEGLIGQQEVIEMERSKLRNELRKKMIYIANNKELLDKVSKKIESVIIDLPAQKEIKSLIKQHERENIWDEYDDDIAKTNEEFFAKLAQINGKLTRNDYRLSALIKMNLSNKEIARLQSRSLESIHMAKSRLRNKLGIIDKEITLVTFLNSL